jgi:hypothetical protein
MKIPRRTQTDLALTYEAKKQLEYNRPAFFPHERIDPDILRQLWAIHGDEITEAFIERWPGQRPHWWWRMEHDMPPPSEQEDWLQRHNLLTAEEKRRL